MQITERQKWDVRHQIGPVLAAILMGVEGTRRHELSDAIETASYRYDSIAGWIGHICNRFDIKLEERWIDDRVWPGELRVDALLAGVNYAALQVASKENASLLAMIARDGPLPVEYMPPSDPPDTTPRWQMPIPKGELIPVSSLRTIWTSESEISHGADEKHGNVILFRREATVDLLTGETKFAPFISGNSVRGGWRDMMIHAFYGLVGLGKGEVSNDLHHSLTSGGVIDSGSELAKVDPALREAVRTLCPPFELLGGIVEKQVCHGAFNVHDAILVCKENVSRLLDPTLYPPPPGLEELAADPGKRVEYALALRDHLRPALSMMELRQSTRHVDPDVGWDGKMHSLWATELVQSGAQWMHHVHVQPTASEFARSCLSWVLDEFAESPYLGAAAARGHGLVAFDPYRPSDTTQALPGPKLFLAHVQDNKALIADWLRSGHVPTSMLPAAPASDPAAKKGKKGKPTPAPAPVEEGIL